jgi:phosphatidylglycerol:prolipoprotein diacylglycerol transferase
MIPYPSLNPDIVHIGPLTVRWYGLMYVLGFVSSYLLVKTRIRKKNAAIPDDFLESFYTVLILGLIAGARLGYILFYNLSFYIEHPLDMLAISQGGMSFHGGLLGCLVACIWYCKRKNIDPWLVADLVTVTAPIGLGLGRLGNFINGELYGRVTNVPWGMVFPGGGPALRHPSQLYEFFFEGVVLFAVLWFLKDRVKKRGAVTALFVMLYGVFRFSLEFFREPDPQLGFVAGPFSMGQVLSFLMFLAGAILFFVRVRRISPTDSAA